MAVWSVLSSAILSVAAIAAMCTRRARREDKDAKACKGYVFTNTVTHRRFLPRHAYHYFTYRTLSIFVSLNTLEQGELDLAGGWLFAYNSRFSICGIRPQDYSTHHFVTKTAGDHEAANWPIRKKLDRVLLERGWDTSAASEVWLATMPSFLGFSMNPLSVYYLYREGGALWLVILEVHNTFGEKHIYVLEAGVNEDSNTKLSAAFDHCWTFPRQFHVSPFNDRSGYYRCFVRAVPPPSQCSPPPRPIIKLDMLRTPEAAERTLTAIISTRTSTPLSTLALLRLLVVVPFALLLTFPRILYEATALHFRKGMDVYPRPEPVAVDGLVEISLDKDNNPVEGAPMRVSGAIGWQQESALEKWARERVIGFVQRRVKDLGGRLNVDLIPTHPQLPTYRIDFALHDVESRRLTITYRSSKFFTTLLCAPSALHALLLGCDAEKLFKPSSRDDFLLFCDTSPFPKPQSILLRLISRIRQWSIPQQSLNKHPIPPGSPHPLDEGPELALLLVVFAVVVLGKLEKFVFTALGARFVPGTEPWNGWQRVDEQRVVKDE